jgi:hypothetical protein
MIEDGRGDFGVGAQSTYCIYLEYHSYPSPRSNWDPPSPSPASDCVPLLNQRGGGQPRLRMRGWGGSNSDDWRKSLALCLWVGVYGMLTLFIF